MGTERIKFGMSGVEIVTAMSDGNPGAITAMIDLMKASTFVDPENALGPFSPLMSLDSLGLYGPRLYMLWNDACGRDATKMLAVLRSWQMGLLSDGEIQGAIDDRGRNLDHPAILAALRERLPSFAAEEGG